MMPAPSRARLGTSQAAPVAYVSQHGLFHQLRETQASACRLHRPSPHATGQLKNMTRSPLLQNDFTVPVYARGGAKLAMVNAWMGTRGTVTHLHTDEHDNFLAQVFHGATRRPMISVE